MNRLLHKHFILLLLFGISLCGFSQDVWLQNHFSPDNGCEMSASEGVTVLINNNSSTTIPSNSITVNYTIDGGATVSELLGVNLSGGASWTFTFSQTVDVSACNTTYDMLCWVEYSGDSNPSNDTVSWTVQNDCTITPGFVTSDADECEGLNNGVLNLNGQTNGYIDSWIYSIDGGTTWYSNGETSDSYNYVDITETTQYAVAIDGGYCPSDTSDFVTITVQPYPEGGSIISSADYCVGDATGTLTLSGEENAIIFWQQSEDDGTSWTTIANTANTHNYNDLQTTTWFRVGTDGAICPTIYSDTAFINVDALSVGGVTQFDQQVCENTTADIEVVGNVGDVQNWEFSTDLITWSSTGLNTSSITTPTISQDTYFRTITKNGLCPEDTSSNVFITVETIMDGGNISGEATHCQSSADGSLVVGGYSGTITDWEFSTDDGDSWSSVSNATDTENYTGLTNTTWYRVYFNQNICPDVYSDTAVVQVLPEPIAGTLNSDADICEGESVDLTLTGSVGDANEWYWSQDLTNWTQFSQDATVLPVSPDATIFYHTRVYNGPCGPDTTNEVTVTVNPAPVVSAGADVYIDEGEFVQITGYGGVTGYWSPSEGLSDPNIPTPEASPSDTTVYTYTVISANGCMASDSMIVFVFLPNKVDIKNVVTPNGDGYNDVWIVEDIERFPQTEVHVFNVYGKEVYASADYKNDWGGTANGKQLPNGSYYYVVQLSDEDEPRKGILHLISHE